MSTFPDRAALAVEIERRYPDAKSRTIRNWATQVWRFAHELKVGDLIVLPLKRQPLLQIGEVKGSYHYAPAGPNPFYHWREVAWRPEPVPRSHFAKDLLFTFGAFLTICRVHHNDAERRILAMQRKNWVPETALLPIGAVGALLDEEPDARTDLETLAKDQIAQVIGVRFKGHDLPRLVEGILRAQGYTTYRSPAGPDGGADILAGAGPLGFGQPRLCVQVKSGDGPAARTTVDNLLAAVKRFSAQEGLFVSWGGFTSNVFRQMATSFFHIRLWSQEDLLDALFACYDQLDPALKAELPLKRIWTVASEE